jgi:DNA-binding MarR family transcriptional regulator
MDPQEIAVMMAARDVGIAMILFRNSLAKQQNLNLTESLCMTLLGVKGQLAPKELARLSGLSSGAMTTLLDRLEKRAYVRRSQNGQDRRGVIIEATDQYRAEAQQSVVNVQKAHRELIQRYKPEELAVIKDFLQGFCQNLARDSDDVAYLLKSL